MARWPRLAAVIVFAAAADAAQRDAPGPPHRTDLAYDGQFTFVRLRWKSDLGFSRRGGFSSAWNHDYPRAEQHLSQILRELTALDIHTDASRILTLDDPDLFKYPLSFMWEPGFWNLTDDEAEAFQAYLAKGGFAVFEDFDNDPSKRLMVVANYDNDVPEYWEWSGQGLFPFDASNEAYKLGVNYVLYGLTH